MYALHTIYIVLITQKTLFVHQVQAEIPSI
jgi:hypothetical protein